ncbi:hypothetical protein KPATCC21470_0648 [Kitasatospora purpeofusca]
MVPVLTDGHGRAGGHGPADTGGPTPTGRTGVHRPGRR